jgi:hypothetical protein
VGDHSAIEWTDATWNPTTGCDRISPGCDHCYALEQAAKLKVWLRKHDLYQVDGDPRTSGPGFGLQLHPTRLDIPRRWRKPRRVSIGALQRGAQPRRAHGPVRDAQPLDGRRGRRRPDDPPKSRGRSLGLVARQA